jgi:hypothetical protein
LFLFCCMAFAQQAMVLHGLTHLKHSSNKLVEVTTPATPSSQPCEQCLAFHGVGGALTDSDTGPAVIGQSESWLFGLTEEFLPFLSAPFRSRAPPFHLQ